MAKRTARCKLCSNVLTRELKAGGICQYCQLKRKINEEIENVQALYEESGNPDLIRQLDELHAMATSLDAETSRTADSEAFNHTKNGTEFEDRLNQKLAEFELLNNSEEVKEEKPNIIHEVALKEETDVDNEEYLRSLPFGWTAKNVKVGFGSIIKHFIDPFGKRYMSRIEAIRTLGKKTDRLDDVLILRSGMVADGWITHPLLPFGWYAKPVSQSSSGNTSLRFLTDKNEWFVGIKKAVKLMNNSDQYTDVDVENLHSFYGQYSCIKRESDSSWVNGEDYLPEGWRYKVIHGTNGDYARVLSPNGEAFSSKSKALQFMVKNNFSESDIQKMSAALVYDGWNESSFLPPEWRYKKCKSGRNEYNFLSPNGDMYASKKTLTAFFRSNEEYSEEDVKNLESLQEEIRVKWIQDKHNWLENEGSVPPGWKIRFFTGVKANKKPRVRCYILSPEGTLFQSRLKALQFMIQKNHPADQIYCMRSNLEKEGWCSHPMLPENWRIKRKITGKGFLFFTSEGFIFSLKKAISYIEKHPQQYTSEDSSGVSFVAKTFADKASPKQSYVWAEHKTVPKGWKVRKIATRDNHGREYFLSPQGKQIGGRIKTIKFLVAQGFSLDHPEIQVLKSGLPGAGWAEDHNIIPPGWMKKKVSKSEEKYKYISPDFKEFHSLTKAYHFMKANKYPVEILNKVRSQLDNKSILSNRRRPGAFKPSSYNWSHVPFLPPDWQFAEKRLRYGQTKRFFLSPSGLLLQKAILAYQVMVEEGINEHFMALMSSQISSEGWEDDHHLPTGWKLNLNQEEFPDGFADDEGLPVLFLTDKAVILSKSMLLKSMNNGDFDDDQTSEFLQLLNKIDDGYDRGWREDPSLPLGWKIKHVDLGFKKQIHLMTADEEEFESIFTTYIHMVENRDSFEEEEIYKIQEKLKEEGFEENRKLPPGWRIIRNRGDNLFELLSKEGFLFATLNAALSFMEGSVAYNEGHLLGVEELCMAEVEAYLNKRAVTNNSNFKTEVEEAC